MSVKFYALSFASSNGDPRVNTGLAPTFLLFFNSVGQTMSPPGIYENFTLSGMYGFTYTSGFSLSIGFLVDGFTTGLGVNRYIKGTLDPAQAIDQSMGWPTDSIGTTAIDPTTMYGLAKRNMEITEGDNIFTAASGVWQMFNRGALGATTLLRTKTLINASTTVTKTGV